MTRIYLLVEGQTEEAFVNELLVPHYARLDRFLTPIIVSTSPGYRGGVVSYAKIKPQIEKLCRVLLAELFDLGLDLRVADHTTTIAWAGAHDDRRQESIQARVMRHQQLIDECLFRLPFDEQVDASHRPGLPPSRFFFQSSPRLYSVNHS